jgi:hypothetical protein
LSEAIENVFGKTQNNVFNISDSLSLQNVFDRAFSHQFNLSETIENVFGKTQSNTFNVSDTTNNTIDKVQNNTFNLSDTLSFVTVFDRIFNSTVSFTDDINGAAVDDDQTVTLFKNTGHSFNVSDLLQNLVNKQPLDTTNISTIGTILNQDYINGADYFSEDYVGVSRTIT